MENLTKVLIAAAFLILIIFLFRKATKVAPARSTTVAMPSGAEVNRPEDLRPITELIVKDPGFDASRIQEKLSNIYVQLQDAWQNRDVSSLQPYFSPILFEVYRRQVKGLSTLKDTDHVERVAVLGLSIEGWYSQNNEDCLVATLDSRCVQYTTENATGDVIAGNKDVEIFRTYEYILSRPAGRTTVDSTQDLAAFTCPNCGGTVDLNRTAICPFCNEPISSSDFGWTIESIKVLSERSSE